MNTIDWSIFILILIITLAIKQFKLQKISSSSIYDKSTLNYGIKLIAIQSFVYSFISLPGQAYSQGITFLQLYLGIPIAVFFTLYVIIPKYKIAKTKNAFEYILNHSDKKIHNLTVVLYLILRILILTITFYAIAMVLSILVKVNFKTLLIFISIGFIVLHLLFRNKNYLFQKHNQLLYCTIIIILIFTCILYKLPLGMYIDDTLSFTASFDKLTLIDSKLAEKDKLDLTKCLINGTILFIALLAMNTKTLQIYRQSKYSYKTKDSLFIYGLLNIPFQFFILLTGSVLFTFYQFNDAPLHYNPNNVHTVKQSIYAEQYNDIKQEYHKILSLRKEASLLYSGQIYQNYSNEVLQDQILSLTENANKLQQEAKTLIKKANDDVEVNDSDFILLHFINFYVPDGITGIIIAIFLISLISLGLREINWLTKSILNILPFEKRSKRNQHPIKNRYFLVSILVIILMLLITYHVPVFLNLIQILWTYASLFSGTLLAILLISMYGKANNQIFFISIIIVQLSIFYLYFTTNIHYLWYNAIGVSGLTVLTFVLSTLYNTISISQKEKDILI
jgi:Na+/proline symporter